MSRLLHIAPAARGDHARRALVDAATAMLRDAPADQLGVAELTRRAGVSRPTFYHHFGTQAALVRVAALTRLQGSLAPLACSESEGDWVVAARPTIRTILAALHDDAQFYRHALQGPASLDLLGDAIDFLTTHIVDDCPLGPLLSRDRDQLPPGERASFLAAGATWHILRWLYSDFTGNNTVDQATDRILVLILTAAGAATVDLRTSAPSLRNRELVTPTAADE